MKHILLWAPGDIDTKSNLLTFLIFSMGDVQIFYRKNVKEVVEDENPNEYKIPDE